MTTSRSNVVDIIKSSITMRDVVDRYGFTPNRSGYINCPFHSEKTASLRIFPGDRGWYCFGCGRGGDAISFVQYLFGVDFPGAIVRLAFDFGINIPNAGHPGAAVESEAVRLRRERQEQIELITAELIQLGEIHREMWWAKREYRPIYCADGTVHIDPRWSAACKWLEYVQYTIDELEDLLHEFKAG